VTKDPLSPEKLDQTRTNEIDLKELVVCALAG